MKHTLGTAAKATGVARSTVLNAIKSGKISADKDAHGNYAIDPAELHRVYPPLAEKQRIEHERKLAATPPEPLTEQAETAVLIEKVKGLEALLTEKDETLKDLRNRLDKTEQARQEADQERREAQRQLTDQRTKPEPTPAPSEPQGKNTLWEKIFGK